ncbi:MAG: imidazole glycerol phosphate synthase subunit HisH [Acidobacteriota bacterium]
MIAIIDYGVGNLGSIRNMFRRIGADAEVGAGTEIRRAHKLVLPGVGAFDAGMKNLSDAGLIALLEDRVLGERVPILGLCLGLQLFGQGSEEGTRAGLGWIEAVSRRFSSSDGATVLRVPHMGWNAITVRCPNPLLDGLDDSSRFYFAHSYHLSCAHAADILATTRHGYPFPSILRKGNIMGTQFHPEKSHRYGLQLLRNFASSV